MHVATPLSAVILVLLYVALPNASWQWPFCVPLCCFPLAEPANFLSFTSRNWAYQHSNRESSYNGHAVHLLEYDWTLHNITLQSLGVTCVINYPETLSSVSVHHNSVKLTWNSPQSYKVHSSPAHSTAELSVLLNPTSRNFTFGALWCTISR